MFQVTIELPESITVSVGATGKSTTVPVKDIALSHPDVIRLAAIAGFTGALNNISRGKDDNDRPNTDDVFVAMREKRVKPWLQGSWGSTERAPRNTSLWRDVYESDCVAVGMTLAQAIAALANKVAERLGKDSKATFDNYIEALAIEAEDESKGKTSRDDARSALEAYYADEAGKRAEAAAKVQDSIKPPKIDLSAFLKPKA